MTDHAANLREFCTLHYVPMTEDERAMILAAAAEIDRLGKERDAVLEECLLIAQQEPNKYAIEAVIRAMKGKP